MICISPISIKDPRQSRGSIRLTVPCGKCGACKFNRRMEWSFRLAIELRYAHTADFLTLTYSDEIVPKNSFGIPTLKKADYRDFLKRLRKFNDGNKKSRIRYYVVGEYGTETHRPHYHMVLFNLRKKTRKHLPKIWGKGHVHVGEVNGKSIYYITKYHVNYDTENKEVYEEYELEPEFARMSKGGKRCYHKGGIGYQWIESDRPKYNQGQGKLVVMNNGTPQKMPRYYKDLMVRHDVMSKEQIQILSEEAMWHMQTEEWKRIEKLERKGYTQDEAAEMLIQDQITASNKVQHKANLRNKL